MFISFTGHAEVYADIADKLSETIEECLEDTNEAVFFVGGQGEFDSMAASAVMAAKSRHEDKDIHLYLVEPHMSKRLNRDKEYYAQRYDEIIIPSELMGIHPKAAIKNRNRLMVDWSDLIIAYVCRNFGGAVQTLQYAQRKHKRIINLAQNNTTDKNPKTP